MGQRFIHKDRRSRNSHVPETTTKQFHHLSSIVRVETSDDVRVFFISAWHDVQVVVALKSHRVDGLIRNKPVQNCFYSGT